MNLSTAGLNTQRFTNEPENNLRFPAKDRTPTAAEIAKKTVANVDTDNSVNLLSQVKPQNATDEQKTTNSDSVKVSSTIGRAATSGQLSREEAVAIYQKIASLL
jgi:hypothetical protein